MLYKPKTYVIIEKAPWDANTVTMLNKEQNRAESQTALYVCPADHGTERAKLRATSRGWECPKSECNFTQDFYYGEKLTI